MIEEGCYALEKIGSSSGREAERRKEDAIEKKV
jgi:hypothetical protein